MSDLKFCPECNNILYAKPDPAKLQLIFLCRQCDYSRWADPSSISDNCVNRTTYHYQTKDDIIVSPLVIKDPTLGRTSHWKCARCGWNKAAFFQLPERVNDDAMMLVFVCCNQGCGYWVKQSYDDDVPAFNTGVTQSATHVEPGPTIEEDATMVDDMADLFGEE
ncbi:DNA-directed RNA polymerase 2 subunit, putative [Babesia bigemina]|uniref:DNA-directed RNA polymerase 2 subunit, putative n=1 Tax=Babesia bigemina TaxID=5866 RepID=A0A061CZV5_BABBI|nr:DNA-directed RNA polymerase 2 subunit, putative [Babesia bigemina]CDR93948.1 DNA-directed RNA polymerase 2 subunit, putative [Babesia bigemina]|eukprot:XP_012766134.1 DNA-directed RNA polymerase 2 subunit, putative [Babesia bigemina]